MFNKCSFIVALLFFLFLNFIDWHWSCECIYEVGLPNKNYVAVECNPVADWCACTFGARYGLGYLKIIGLGIFVPIILFIYQGNRKLAWVELLFFIVLFLVVVGIQFHGKYLL